MLFRIVSGCLCQLAVAGNRYPETGIWEHLSKPFKLIFFAVFPDNKLGGRPISC